MALCFSLSLALKEMEFVLFLEHFAVFTDLNEMFLTIFFPLFLPAFLFPGPEGIVSCQAEFQIIMPVTGVH